MVTDNAFRFGVCVFIVCLALLLVGRASATERCGKASWYGLTGITASGEKANPKGFTAAHRSLPFGTRVAVENLRNGRMVHVRVNDRGPHRSGRIIDVTRRAAAELGFLRTGVAPVRITIPGQSDLLEDNC